MNIKKTFATISEKKIELRRKALILGGTAVGIIIAYTVLSKVTPDDGVEIFIDEENGELIIKDVTPETEK